MELFSGLITYFQGLMVSSLLVLELMGMQGYQLFSSFAQTFTNVSETKTVELSPSSSDSSDTHEAHASTSIASSTKKLATTTQKIPVKKVTSPSLATTTSSTTSSVPKTLTPLVDPEKVNADTRQSIVNILCVTQSSGSVRSISGSGVIIDSRGIILTNAHVGQYFLLTDYPTKGAVDCVIRTGSPATPLYHATLLYLPPAWISTNAGQIVAEQSMGTGEYDYAFLKISSTTNPQGTLPSTFKNLPMSAAAPSTGDQMLVAGYPAGFLDGITIEKSLYATSAFTAVGQLYTFNDARNVDVISVGGTVVSQGGSSGGAVVRTYDGQLVGLISTATAGETTSSRDLRAITVGYINKSLAEAGKGGLIELLSGDLSVVASNFAPTYAQERQKLIDAIERR